MQFSLPIFSAVLLVYNAVAATTNNNVEGPYGLTFTPTAILVSRFNASNSVETTQYSTSSEFQRLYHDAVDEFDPEKVGRKLPTGIERIFHDAIRPVNESLSKQLGHEPEFSSLFLPSVFHYKVRQAASSMIFPDRERTFKVGPSREAACYGFGFLDGRNLGRAPEACNGDGPESSIFVLEYEKEYLYAFFMEVTFELGTYYVDRDMICKDCGEKYRQKLGAKAYANRLEQFLDDFMKSKVLSKHKREDVRAVVITGEASSIGNAELGDIALRVVGTSEVKLMTEIEHSEVVAYGAAIWARRTQQRPEKFITHGGNRVMDEQYHADNEAAYRRSMERRDEL